MNAIDDKALAFAPPKPKDDATSKSPSAAAPVDLELRKLSRRIDSRVLVNDISFAVTKGSQH